jgi:hypothetical protein
MKQKGNECINSIQNSLLKVKSLNATILTIKIQLAEKVAVMSGNHTTGKTLWGKI